MKAQISVLHILNELRPSGAEVMLYVASPYWDKYGVQCEILTLGERLGSYEMILRQHYRIIHIPLEKTLRSYIKIIKFFWLSDYDVVHIHTERANFWLAIIAKLTGTKRVVRTIHSIFAFSGLLRIERYLQRFLLSTLGVTHVAIGNSVKISEAKYYNNKAELVYNWFDTDKYSMSSDYQCLEARKKLGIDESMFVIISVGNCSDIKNHSALIRAIAMLPKTLKIIYLHIGEEQLEFPERNLAQELGIMDLIKFIGYQEDIAAFLKAADVYVMPSTHEGLGIAALEAIGAGLPSILAQVPGLQDLKEFIDGIYWVDIKPENIMSAIMDLMKLLKEERKEIGQRMSLQASKYFGVERGVNSYIQIYRNGLEKFRSF